MQDIPSDITREICTYLEGRDINSLSMTGRSMHESFPDAYWCRLLGDRFGYRLRDDNISCREQYRAIEMALTRPREYI